MASVDDQRAELKTVLDRAESWLRDLELGPDLSFGPPTLEEDMDAIKQLRTRAGSAGLAITDRSGRPLASTTAGREFISEASQILRIA